MQVNICDNCVYCIKDEGEPYYCAIQDLFTWVKATDEACDDAVIMKNKECAGDAGNKRKRTEKNN